MRTPSRLPSRSSTPNQSRPSAPGLLETVAGWRVWRVDPRYRLRSVLREDVWEPLRPLVAACEKAHAAPVESCGCGVYAVLRPEQARPYLVGRNSPEGVYRVIGRVALWGRVVECEQGWRGERAYPVRLWVPACYEAFEIAFELGRYGVPVELLPALRPGAVSFAA
jgi:hypothetical protein